MGAVTVVTSGKGGAGKSTVTAGLGIALARRGKRVLLIDGDAGLRSLDCMLSVEENLLFDIADVVAGNCEPIRAIYPCPHVQEGLFLLPAPAGEEDIVAPAVMRQLVPVLSPYYDHILIDSPAGIGRGFLSAVAAAQRALVVATPDLVCLRDCDRVRTLLLEKGIAAQRLVINRFSYRDFTEYAGNRDMDSVIDQAGIRLIAVIPEDAKLRGSFGNGLPYKRSWPAGQAFDRLAARLEGENIPLAPLEKL